MALVATNSKLAYAKASLVHPLYYDKLESQFLILGTIVWASLFKHWEHLGGLLRKLMNSCFRIVNGSSMHNSHIEGKLERSCAAF